MVSFSFMESFQLILQAVYALLSETYLKTVVCWKISLKLLYHEVGIELMEIISLECFPYSAVFLDV